MKPEIAMERLDNGSAEHMQMEQVIVTLNIFRQRFGIDVVASAFVNFIGEGWSGVAEAEYEEAIAGILHGLRSARASAQLTRCGGRLNG